ncbi:hypothetical protein BBJ28_00003003 [Nothophytophthora sp. Chile5]|nr:hypothetical protein BBJ28_00003003 [Nothophytophthora sp. Chile5]
MEGDLYGGLVVPKKTKRERREEAEGAAEASDTRAADAASEDLPAKRQRVQKAPLDLASTVAKLKGYMLVDKKFPKASALLCQLMADQLTVDTSDLFMETLTELIDAKGAVWSGKKEFQTLVEALNSKRSILLTGEDSERAARERKLEAWNFLAITHALLFTDETYQFGKAVKVVQRRFEALVVSIDGQDGNQRAQRLHVELMPLLRTIYTKLGVVWATTMAETVLALATRHRLLFTEDDREEIDAWTRAVRDRRSAPAIARSAGSDARRNLVASSGSEAGAKIPGRVNHPLFNREM